MNELSLFTGAGGGVWGSKLLGWRTIGYVENNDYCQRVLAQRIADGFFESAPIFGDIQAFNDQGYARRYRGMVGVVTAGFPCTPFSVAGKRRGADDPRNMWPATIATIREVRPRFAFLENVPALLTNVYFGTILGDLAESGYDARWCVLGADDVGAPHRRKRLWILAHTERWGRGEGGEATRREARIASDGLREDGEAELADAECDGREQSPQVFRRRKSVATNCCENVSDAERDKLRDEQGTGEERETTPKPGNDGEKRHVAWWDIDPADLPDAECGDAGGNKIGRASRAGGWERQQAEAIQGSGRGGREEVGLSIAESRVGRVADGVADRVKRLRALGNGQVPAVAAAAWRLLSEGIDK